MRNIRRYSSLSDEEISERIRRLDREWDIERVLGTNMSVLAITGVILSQVKDRRWLVLPATVLGFYTQHSLQGWCPPLTLLRMLKIRTRNEINQEKHALKAIRGDYEDVMSPEEAFVAAKKN
jgi:hypothetical protein